MATYNLKLIDKSEVSIQAIDVEETDVGHLLVTYCNDAQHTWTGLYSIGVWEYIEEVPDHAVV